MKLNYENTMILLERLRGSNGVDWNPDKHQLLLFSERGNYTYNKNRLDNLNLQRIDYELAVEIKPINEDNYEVLFLSMEEVQNF